MNEENWEVVDSVQGQLQAEILRGLLEANGIRVWLNQEGAGVAYGITVGPLGTVEILVPTSSVALAQELLDAYYAGELERPDDEEAIEEDTEDGGDNVEV